MAILGSPSFNSFRAQLPSPANEGRTTRFRTPPVRSTAYPTTAHLDRSSNPAFPHLPNLRRSDGEVLPTLQASITTRNTTTFSFPFVCQLAPWLCGSWFDLIACRSLSGPFLSDQEMPPCPLGWNAIQIAQAEERRLRAAIDLSFRFPNPCSTSLWRQDLNPKAPQVRTKL